MPMDRTEFRAHKARLDRTNCFRHLRQADKAADHAGVAIAGIVLVFNHQDPQTGEVSEVHYFDAPWINPDLVKEIRKAALGQLQALMESEV
jgi:hypothetical protein